MPSVMAEVQTPLALGAVPDSSTVVWDGYSSVHAAREILFGGRVCLWHQVQWSLLRGMHHVGVWRNIPLEI